MIDALVSHAPARHLPKLVVDLREQPIERGLVAARMRLKQLGESLDV
jgi:hypothetical protein